jgi:hypothetical protein
MSNTETKTTPRTIKVACIDCGQLQIFPNKGFGRIGAILFRQDHKCEESK